NLGAAWQPADHPHQGYIAGLGDRRDGADDDRQDGDRAQRCLRGGVYCRCAVLSRAYQRAGRRSASHRNTDRREILTMPHARIAIAPLLNNSLTAVKQTSYASVVGVWELTYAAREVVERTLASFQIFLGVMVIYFVICYPLSVLARWCERQAPMVH